MKCRICNQDLPISRLLDGTCKECQNSENKVKEVETAHTSNAGESSVKVEEDNLNISKKTDDSFIKTEEGTSDGLKIIDASIPFGSVLILVFKIAISILIVYLIFLPILGLLGFAGLAAFF